MNLCCAQIKLGRLDVGLCLYTGILRNSYPEAAILSVNTMEAEPTIPEKGTRLSVFLSVHYSSKSNGPMINLPIFSISSLPRPAYAVMPSCDRVCVQGYTNADP